MVSSTVNAPPQESGPAWDVARLYPAQGQWDEGDYFVLTSTTNRLVELVDGYVEVLEMPKPPHQFIAGYLYRLLFDFVAQRQLGHVLFAPVNVRLRPQLIRQPDVVFLFKEHEYRIGSEALDSADLVMEVVSDDANSRHRDLVTKRKSYAESGIDEYWIVDPQQRHIIVLRREDREYLVHGEWGSGARATSRILTDFSVDVTSVFAAGDVAK